MQYGRCYIFINYCRRVSVVMNVFVCAALGEKICANIYAAAGIQWKNWELINSHCMLGIYLANILMLGTLIFFFDFIYGSKNVLSMYKRVNMYVLKFYVRPNAINICCTRKRVGKYSIWPQEGLSFRQIVEKLNRIWWKKLYLSGQRSGSKDQNIVGCGVSCGVGEYLGQRWWLWVAADGCWDRL